MPQALTIAPRMLKPRLFAGTDTTWRVLCDLYPAAETPEIVMALLDYCSVRKLDPFKRPVHIVPMYNSKLRRKVQTVMQGINEIEITAARSGKWAGMEPPVWGPECDRTFRGSFERDDGTVVNTEVALTYPVSCAVTVYRLVGEQPRAFTEELFWDECYGRAQFRSEMPNDRWQKAPRQMLHKCVKAAVLRAAFPEDITEYAAEEMEGREIEAGGVVIDGEMSPPEERAPPANGPARTASPAGQAEPPAKPPPDEAAIADGVRALGARFDAIAAIKDHDSLVSDPAVAKQLDWLRKNRKALYRDAQERIKASWTRCMRNAQPPPAAQAGPEPGGDEPDGAEPPPHPGAAEPPGETEEGGLPA